MPKHDYVKLELAFRSSIESLPNYKRIAAWEYVNALKDLIAKRDQQLANEALSEEESWEGL